jgi:hypothetical protein
MNEKIEDILKEIQKYNSQGQVVPKEKLEELYKQLDELKANTQASYWIEGGLHYRDEYQL